MDEDNMPTPIGPCCHRRIPRWCRFGGPSTPDGRTVMDCDGLCVGLWVWILDDLWMIIIYYGGKKPDQDHHQLS